MKRAKKLIVRFAILLISMGFVGIIALFCINLYITSSVKGRVVTVNESVKIKNLDCIIILGAGVWKNNTPSPMLKDRLDQGIELYKAGVSNRLLMSGDHGRTNYDEVNVMKQYAIDAGVPSEDIFMDHAGFSTYESMYRARDIFQVKKMLVITQKYHMYRSLYDGKGLGLDVYGITSDPRQYRGQNYREAREILARCKDFFYIIVKPKPTYLGDVIPVSGNGNSTNDK